MYCHTGMPPRHSIQNQGRPFIPLMWNVTLEYTTTHFNALGHTPSGNPSPTFHTHQQTLNSYDAVVVSQKLSRSVPYPPGLQPRTWGVQIHCAICSPKAASYKSLAVSKTTFNGTKALDFVFHTKILQQFLKISKFILKEKFNMEDDEPIQQ